MRQSKPFANRNVAIPYRLQTEGWWLIPDLQTPCNGSQRLGLDCALYIPEGDTIRATHTGIGGVGLPISLKKAAWPLLVRDLSADLAIRQLAAKAV